MGGAIARVPETATAFHVRTHAYSLLLLGGWVDPAETESNVAWVRELWDRTQPLSSSAVYVNYLGTEGQGRVLDAYGPNHARLSAIKAKYDPGNFFRLNQNVERAAVALVGGKGANLGDLARAGFPVPNGFVLTTRAYEMAAEAAGVDPARPSEAAERLRAAPMLDAIANAARKAYAALDAERVAVRSSATAEDLPRASFAGKQDSYLDVSGEESLLDAIRRCWASLWNERAVAYRHASGVNDTTVSLAVVVQEMVDASAAGVLFTADPVTGRRPRAALGPGGGPGEKPVPRAAGPDPPPGASTRRRWV